MFTFLTIFCDENPRAYLFTCCVIFLIWARMLYARLFDSCSTSLKNDSSAPTQYTPIQRRSNVATVFKRHATNIPWIEGIVFDFNRCFFPSLSTNMQIFCVARQPTIFFVLVHVGDKMSSVFENAIMLLCLLISIGSAESNRLRTSIGANLAEKCLMGAPLAWNGFDKQPLGMQFENTGFDGNFMQISRREWNKW